MSFWDMNDGSTVEATASYEVEGGDMKPIPDNTGCIAAIEEAKWDDYEGDRYISLKWRVMRPSEYEKRVIYHKVKVFGMAKDKDKQATADKAKRMLAAIDQNAGGKLMKVKGEPSDSDLMSALVGKMMAIKVKVWEIDKDKNGKAIPKEERKSGNWICAVAPSKGGQKAAPKAEEKPAPAAPIQAVSNDFDDDIPFN